MISFTTVAPAPITEFGAIFKLSIIVAPAPIKESLLIDTLPQIVALGAMWHPSEINVSCSITELVLIMQSFPITEFGPIYTKFPIYLNIQMFLDIKKLDLLLNLLIIFKVLMLQNYSNLLI